MSPADSCTMVTAILLWRPWSKAQFHRILVWFHWFYFFKTDIFTDCVTTPDAAGMYPGMASLLCGLQQRGCNLDTPKLKQKLVELVPKP